MGAVKRFDLNLNLSGVVVLIAAGVLFPVMLSTAVGIVAVAIAGDVGGIVTGVLVISFTAAAMGSALIAVVLTGRKAQLARRQSDFVAGVSHELRTPISAIKLCAQTLKSGNLTDDTERTADCVAAILRETEWLSMMVDGVLAWRASSRDMVALRMKRETVSGAVQSAIERFRSMVVEDEMELRASIETRLPVLHDPAALNTVVLNLLTNAYKYTGRDKSAEIAVRDAGARVEIEVRDNGIGLSGAEIKQVFDPFFRAVKTQSAGSGGVGLGLAIVRHLVQRHGGTVTVASSIGQGSAFTVCLPAAEEKHEP